MTTVAWDLSLCAQTDPEVFYPEKGGSPRDAKKICLSCEVRAECLEYALAHDERFGVWGGLTETERRPLHRAYVKAHAGPEATGCGDAKGTEKGYGRHRRRKEDPCTACTEAATEAGNKRKQQIA